VSLNTQWTIKNVAVYFRLELWLILTNFLWFSYHFNRQEIIHATVVKFTTSP